MSFRQFNYCQGVESTEVLINSGLSFLLVVYSRPSLGGSLVSVIKKGLETGSRVDRQARRFQYLSMVSPQELRFYEGPNCEFFSPPLLGVLASQ